MSAAASVPRRRQGEYGVDAPWVPLGFALASLALAGITLRNGRAGAAWSTVASGYGAAFFAAGAASYLYTTRRGKFAVWADLLRGLDLRGDERLLDLGCGRGAVLLMAAQLLPRGEAVGVDLWHAADQSGSSATALRRNAEREGVADRVRIVTADMRALPFADAAFDVVVSSVAIHNIDTTEGRARAVAEAARVLRPGGRLLIADIRASGEYADLLRRRGLSAVERRGLGWRFWYGGPWVAAELVTGQKPA